jgi:hypothetical protein
MNQFKISIKMLIHNKNVSFVMWRRDKTVKPILNLIYGAVRVAGEWLVNSR